MSGPDSVATLVARLTLEEKIAQLGGLALPALMAYDPRTGPGLDISRLAELCPDGIGHLSLAWFLAQDADGLRDAIDRVQKAVREVSPFGIGGLVHFEGVNGFLHPAGEQFPTAWAQAATWDPELVRRAASVTAAHMSDLGVQLVFSPVMDLARDPRWGRVHETYGEDPELVAQCSVAFVRGIQEGTGLLATGKHFLGFGASEAGRNMATTQLGRRTLVDEYAEPFRRAIAEAGLSVVMNSYNEIDGIPAVANRWLLTDLLRGQLGLDGIVVSDYESVQMLRTRYRTAAEPGLVAAQALTAGLDAELPQTRTFPHLSEEVRSGRLDESVIDQAVTRVLQIKARAGLIPGLGPTAAPRHTPERGEAASVRREIAEQGTVLLQNDGILPLRAGAGRIVLTGPVADELRIHFGAYTSVAAAEMPAAIKAVRTGQIPGVDPATFNSEDIVTTPLPTLQSAFEDMARALHPQAQTLLQALGAQHPDIVHAPLGSLVGGEPLEGEVESAVADADVIIAVVGERTGRVGANTAGEGRSSAGPVLPGSQDELLQRLAATGKPVVTVVVSGRPLVLTSAAHASNALLLAPLLGEVAADTVAAAIFGEREPAGRLPMTFPRHLGQVPIYHGHRHGSGYDHPTGDTYSYIDLEDQSPLFAFGHGLSYTSFEVEFTGAVEVVDGQVRVPVRIRNTGDRDGQAVVQVYARVEHARVVRPVRQLLQFQRCQLAAGTSQEVILRAPLQRLHYTQEDGRRGLEAGDVTVMAGLSSNDIHCAATLRMCD